MFISPLKPSPCVLLKFTKLLYPDYISDLDFVSYFTALLFIVLKFLIVYHALHISVSVNSDIYLSGSPFIQVSLDE